MSTSLDKFQSLLRELFQFAHADLDFGVYRIMNLRRDQLERWLRDELPARVREILGPDDDAADLEPLVYNHLYDFFSRYYDNGDFAPKRRRSFASDGRDTYAIGWDGEEVVLHWSNKDQYYVKTGERFTHYRWQAAAAGRTFTIEFRLTDADIPANNNKDTKRKFYLPVPNKIEWQESQSTLVVPFHYRGLTIEEESQYADSLESGLRERVITHIVSLLVEHPRVTSVDLLAPSLMSAKRDAEHRDVRDKHGTAVPLLRHHLNRWTAKNESDFFIHKNLRRFLSGELDYYLKSVVLNLDNLLAAGPRRVEPNLRLLEAVRRLGAEIVDFVSQFEEFQKALFEKQKFVLETSWCLTLDRVPTSVREAVYAAILANDRQWAVWESLYQFSRWPDALDQPVLRSREFLDAYPHLMLDTALGYSPDLCATLLGAIEDLEQATDGVLVHADNFHALALLRNTFSSRCTVGYIDPPYNKSNGADFIYKDSFRHSSWLAMVADRLELIKTFLEPRGILWTSLDENEAERFHELSGGMFGEAKLLPAITNLKGLYDADGFIATHEYVICACMGSLTDVRELDVDDEALDSAWQADEFGYFKPGDGLRRTGADAPRSRRPNGWFPVFVNDQLAAYATPDDRPLAAGDHALWPVGGAGEELSWSWSKKKINDEPHNLLVRGSRESGFTIIKKQRPTMGEVPSRKARSFLYKPEYSSTHGASTTRNLFGERMSEFTPKSVALVTDLLKLGHAHREAWVLDAFAGSGTTGHAVVALNRSDAGCRKYLLTEMGSAFDDVLKPRLQKVVFSEHWRDGIPVRHANPAATGNSFHGVSHCFKVLRLESYEDALDNIDFNVAAAPGAELGTAFRRDYELRYALDWESKDCSTRLNVEQFDAPLDYTLTLRRETGAVTITPDLPETFAYLLGLRTRRRFRVERDGVCYLIHTGALRENGAEVAVLWRTCRGWTERDLEAEKIWWREQHGTLAPRATRVYVNGASAIEGHYSLDAEFKIRMRGGNF